jgi:RNAse (barnase) inhibitor barstar
MEIAEVECDRIHDWESFHDEFIRIFGFPEFYGRNMNAWIDCLSYIDSPQENMSRIHCKPGCALVLVLKNAESFKHRCPEQWESLNECAAFVNWRSIEKGEPPLLSLAYYV